MIIGERARECIALKTYPLELLTRQTFLEYFTKSQNLLLKTVFSEDLPLFKPYTLRIFEMYTYLAVFVATVCPKRTAWSLLID